MSRSRLEYALEAASFGLRVFPCHTRASSGGCSCGLKHQCPSAGKHPILKDWQQVATTDPKCIRQLWNKHPRANIGIATGSESGVFELDIDPRHGGNDALAELEREHGKLPDTWEFITGGGGRGILFRHPGGQVANRAHLFAGGDIRGDGGLTIGPGSEHASGRLYEWESSCHPADIPIADAPTWLLARLSEGANARPISGTREEGPAADPDPVFAGCAWLRHCRDDAAGLGEAPWKALSDLCARFENGLKLFHLLSQPHPGYREADATKKFRHAQKSPGPPTCAHIRGVLDGEPYCAGCVHWQRIKSPLELARTREARLELLAPPPSTRIDVGTVDDLPELPDTAETHRPFADAGPATPETTPALREAEAGQARGGQVGTDAAEIPGTLDWARITAKLAVQEAANDAGRLLDPDSLRALALIRAFDARTWATLKQKIVKTKGITLGEIAGQFPAVALHELDGGGADWDDAPDEEPQDGLRRISEVLPSCPHGEVLVPKDFELKYGHTYRVQRDREGVPERVVVALAPVGIAGRLKDAVTGIESLLVFWQRRGEAWRTQVIQRGTVMSGKRLADMADTGFPISDSNSKALVDYLYRMEAANDRRLPTAAVSSRLGWQGHNGAKGFLVGRSLVLPDGQILSAQDLDLDRPGTWDPGTVRFHGLGEGDDQLVDAYHKRGTLQGWLDAISVLQHFPRALIALYAAFVPPLLELFGVRNFVINWSNRTSTGKTTSLRVAASPWGCPDEREDLSVIGSWDATKVWMERASAVVSGLPFLLDDTQKAPKPRHPRDEGIVKQVVYAIASGQGKSRGNQRGIDRTHKFHTVLFSTGEAPIKSFTQAGGVLTRTVEIRGVPFENADLDTGRLVGKLNADLCAHYGHAGPQFISWLMKERAGQGQQPWSYWLDFYQRCYAKYSESPPSAEAGRIAAYAAIITVAGSMAHQALGLPWKHSQPIGTLWHDLAKEADNASGEVRALQDLVSWAHSRQSAFIAYRPAAEEMTEDGPVALGAGWTRPAANVTVLGRWDAGQTDQWAFLAVYQTVLKQALLDLGFEPETIIAGWREEGWLELDSAGKLTQFVKTGERSPVRMVVIKREAIERVQA